MKAARETFYTPNPAVESDYILEAFFHQLTEAMPIHDRVDPHAVAQRTQELERIHGDRATDDLSISHLRYACAVLAAYETLLRNVAEDRALSTVRRAFVRSGEFVGAKTRAGLDQASDAFRASVTVCGSSGRPPSGTAGRTARFTSTASAPRG